MTTTHKYWTKREINRMKTMRESGMTWEAIGAKLKRSPGACSSKGSREGFAPITDDRRLSSNKQNWTPEQDAMIFAGLDALSELIGKPASAVASHIGSLLVVGRFREEALKLKVVA